MSKKKKKHYKQSISGKLRNDAAKHFKKHKNNVTRAAYIKNYDKFILFCRTVYDCKTKEECAEHIDDYIEYLKEKKHTASTTISMLANTESKLTVRVATMTDSGIRRRSIKQLRKQ